MQNVDLGRPFEVLLIDATATKHALEPLDPERFIVVPARGLSGACFRLYEAGRVADDGNYGLDYLGDSAHAEHIAYYIGACVFDVLVVTQDGRTCCVLQGSDTVAPSVSRTRALPVRMTRSVRWPFVLHTAAWWYDKAVQRARRGWWRGVAHALRQPLRGKGATSNGDLHRELLNAARGYDAS